jgi:hypothetical protein
MVRNPVSLRAYYALMNNVNLISAQQKLCSQARPDRGTLADTESGPSHTTCAKLTVGWSNVAASTTEDMETNRGTNGNCIHGCRSG